MVAKKSDVNLPPEEEERWRKRFNRLAIVVLVGMLLASPISQSLFGDDRLVGALLFVAVGSVCLGNVWLNLRDYGFAQVMGRNVGKASNRAGYWAFVGLHVLVGVSLLMMAVYLVFREQTAGE